MLKYDLDVFSPQRIRRVSSSSSWTDIFGSVNASCHSKKRKKSVSPDNNRYFPIQEILEKTVKQLLHANSDG